MEKYIYDNSNGLWYELHGYYYLPCLVIPEEEIHTIGIWGKKHQQYLRDHRSMVYTDLVLGGKLQDSDASLLSRKSLYLLFYIILFFHNVIYLHWLKYIYF